MVASQVMQLIKNGFINGIMHYIFHIHVEKIKSLLNNIFVCKHEFIWCAIFLVLREMSVSVYVCKNEFIWYDNILNS